MWQELDFPLVLDHLRTISLVWLMCVMIGTFCACWRYGAWWLLWTPLLSLLVAAIFVALGTPFYEQGMKGVLWAYGTVVLSGALPFTGALVVEILRRPREP